MGGENEGGEGGMRMREGRVGGEGGECDVMWGRVRSHGE